MRASVSHRPCGDPGRMRACSFQLSELVRQNRDFLVSEQSVINANLVEKFAEK